MATEQDISKDFLNEIGLKIKRSRLAKKMSLEQLGLEIGLTRMQVHRIENGYNITLKTLLKLSLALDIAPSLLLKTKQKLKREDLEKLVNLSKAAQKKK